MPVGETSSPRCSDYRREDVWGARELPSTSLSASWRRGAEFHLVRRELESVLGLVDHQTVEPAPGLAAVPEPLMGHGQEDKFLRDTRTPTAPNALVQPTDGCFEAAGAIE